MSIEQRKLLGGRIRELREKRGLTQEQLAVMIGNGSKQYISSVENGAKNVTIDVLCRIAKALDSEVHNLFIF